MSSHHRRRKGHRDRHDDRHHTRHSSSHHGGTGGREKHGGGSRASSDAKYSSSIRGEPYMDRYEHEEANDPAYIEKLTKEIGFPSWNHPYYFKSVDTTEYDYGDVSEMITDLITTIIPTQFDESKPARQGVMLMPRVKKMPDGKPLPKWYYGSIPICTPKRNPNYMRRRSERRGGKSTYSADQMASERRHSSNNRMRNERRPSSRERSSRHRGDDDSSYSSDDSRDYDSYSHSSDGTEDYDDDDGKRRNLDKNSTSPSSLEVSKAASEIERRNALFKEQSRMNLVVEYRDLLKDCKTEQFKPPYKIDDYEKAEPDVLHSSMYSIQTALTKHKWIKRQSERLLNGAIVVDTLNGIFEGIVPLNPKEGDKDGVSFVDQMYQTINAARPEFSRLYNMIMAQKGGPAAMEGNPLFNVGGSVVNTVVSTICKNYLKVDFVNMNLGVLSSAISAEGPSQAAVQDHRASSSSKQANKPAQSTNMHHSISTSASQRQQQQQSSSSSTKPNASSSQPRQKQQEPSKPPPKVVVPESTPFYEKPPTAPSSANTATIALPTSSNLPGLTAVIDTQSSTEKEAHNDVKTNAAAASSSSNNTAVSPKDDQNAPAHVTVSQQEKTTIEKPSTPSLAPFIAPPGGGGSTSEDDESNDYDDASSSSDSSDEGGTLDINTIALNKILHKSAKVGV